MAERGRGREPRDRHYLRQALRLARRGLYSTTPNPRVGCVVVREGRVIGQGWHQRAGGPHAEIVALQQAGEARGATVYVTLEPCSHVGRTAPCSDALIAAGVRRVVVAMADPNPRVSGRGLERLAEAGIEVVSGELAEEARELNPGYARRMSGGLPWLRLKLAASLDGRTAMASGESQWITGPVARADVQRWRARSCAVLTGVGTVLADDCQLTVRGLGIGRQPLRVVLDTALRTPPGARLLAGDGPVLIAHAGPAGERGAALRERGAELICLPGAGNRVDAAALLKLLAQRGINEVLAETGPTLAGSLWRAGQVDELLLYQAPTLLGSQARPLLELELEHMAQQQRLVVESRVQLGEDWRLLARPRPVAERSSILKESRP